MTQTSNPATPPAGLSNPVRALLSFICALVFGPPIGGVVALVGFVATGTLPELQPAFGISMIAAFLPLFYVLGGTPAAAAGLVFAGVVWRHGTVGYRTAALISLAGGVIAALILVGPVMQIPNRVQLTGGVVNITAALVAALATRALIGAFGILRPEFRNQ